MGGECELSGFLLFEKDVGSFSGGCMEFSLWVALSWVWDPSPFLSSGVAGGFAFAPLAVGILVGTALPFVECALGAVLSLGIYAYALAQTVSVLPDGLRALEAPM